MIYTASYFEPHRHHGKRLSISRSIPAGFQVEGRLECLILSADLLQAWKAKRINETEYTNRYREQIKMNLPIIKHWLANLDSEEDMTLLCWESSGINKILTKPVAIAEEAKEQPFCHRHLAIKLVQKFRPDCYGGMDIINYSSVDPTKSQHKILLR